MGLSAFGALICIGLAYLALSPNFTRRNRTLAARLIPRLRMLNGLALALLLMGMGFFLAGVPLEEMNEDEMMAMAESTAVAMLENENELGLMTNSETLTDTVGMDEEEPDAPTVVPQPTSSTPESGAFARPPSSDEADLTDTSPVTGTTGTVNASANPPDVPTSTPSPTPTPSNTPTPTPSPTITPTPTFTPTPIAGNTAVITLGGGTVWLRQSPTDNAAQVILIDDGAIVLPTGRRANVAGTSWTEVQTSQGRTGWLRTQFLNGVGFSTPTPTP